MRQYLEYEGFLLATADEEGYAHYRTIKDRFNTDYSSFDFIFLSRAGFNGMMRFNRRGQWNIPFCKNLDDLHLLILRRYAIRLPQFNGLFYRIIGNFTIRIS